MATRSELTNFIEDIDEKVLECSICLKRLTNPKSLKCLHSFCLTCLKDWVKTNGNKLICPTCSTSYPIPKGGIRKLQPNTILNNLLETIEQFSGSGRDQIKCVCGKIPPRYYCPECGEYLCFACSDHHKDHKPISIVMALNAFRESSKKAEEFAKLFVSGNIQLGLKEFSRNATELEQSKDRCLVDIDDHVRELVKTIKINGEQVKNKVKTNYTKKKAKLDALMNHLRTEMSDMNKTLSLLNHTSKLKNGTAMKSGTKAITEVYAAIKNHYSWLSLVKLDNYEQTYFFKNEQQFISLQQGDIGYVSRKMKADMLTLKGDEESVSQGQTIIKVIKTDECEIDTNQLKATWTQPTGETNISQVEEDENGDYIVTEKCTSPGVCRLHVNVVTDNKEIKKSPKKFRVKKKYFFSNIYLHFALILFGVLFLYMIGLGDQPINKSQTIIDAKKEGLVNSIDVAGGSSVFKLFCNVMDVVECGGDCLLVSVGKNTIYKYNHSGEYIGGISLPSDVNVNNMYRMRNGNIAFGERFNRCVKVCDMNGKVVKSIGEGVLNYPVGIEVDDVSNQVYVAEENWFSTSLFIFDVYSGNYIKKLEPPFKFKFTIIDRHITLFNIANRQLMYAVDIESKMFMAAGELSDPSGSKYVKTKSNDS